MTNSPQTPDLTIAPKRLRRYLIVGLGTNGALYLMFLFLIWLRMPPIIASALCYAIGVTGSYLLNRHWTFASSRPHMEDIAKYLAAYGFGLIVTLVSMAFLVGPLGPAVAQVLTIGFTAIVIYGALEVLKFGQ